MTSRSAERVSKNSPGCRRRRPPAGQRRDCSAAFWKRQTGATAQENGGVPFFFSLSLSACERVLLFGLCLLWLTVFVLFFFSVCAVLAPRKSLGSLGEKGA